MVSRVSTHVWSRLSYKSRLGSSHFLLLFSSLLPSGNASQLYTPLPISSNFSPFVNTKITTFPEGLFNEIKGERTPSPFLYDTEAQPLLLRSPPSQIKTARCLWASSQNWTSLGSPWITSCSSGSTGSRESRFVFSFFRVGFRSSKLIVFLSFLPSASDAFLLPFRGADYIRYDEQTEQILNVDLIPAKPSQSYFFLLLSSISFDSPGLPFLLQTSSPPRSPTSSSSPLPQPSSFSVFPLQPRSSCSTPPTSRSLPTASR